MQAFYDLVYGYGLPLKLTGLIVAACLIASHLLAIVKPSLVKSWMPRFPRHEKIGIALAILTFGWALFIWSYMDLGDFFKVKKIIQIVIIGVGIGVVIYVKEFLAVRTLGFLLILLAAPMLESAFLKEPESRLFLVALAYVIAVVGMFWMGMPYLLRDQIRWILAKESRYRIGAYAGLAYGVILGGCALLWW